MGQDTDKRVNLFTTLIRPVIQTLHLLSFGVEIALLAGKPMSILLRQFKRFGSNTPPNINKRDH